MNLLIAGLSDFLERAAEETDDLGLTEADSIRLNLLLEHQEFAKIFASTALEPDDIELMSTDAWVWYLQWRSSRAEPPSSDFLSALYDSTEDQLIRNEIVESLVVAARYARTPTSTPSADWGIHDIPMAWIRQQFLAASASAQQREHVESSYLRLDEGQRAADIVSNLLMLGDDYSIGAIRAFLQANPPDRADLTARALEWISETNGRIRSEWLRNLGFPNNSPGAASEDFSPEQESL